VFANIRRPRAQAKNRSAIKIFHRISAPEAIFGEISGWIQALCSEIKIFHRNPPPKAVSRDLEIV
jgi:hypothetical protein